MRLKTSSEAERDIYEIHEFGSLNYGTDQADRYVDALRGMFDFLARFPLVARERANMRPPVRLYPYGAHNVIYRVDDNELLIVRVLHHSADWKDWL